MSLPVMTMVSGKHSPYSSFFKYSERMDRFISHRSIVTETLRTERCTLLPIHSCTTITIENVIGKIKYAIRSSSVQLFMNYLDHLNRIIYSHFILQYILQHSNFLSEKKFIEIVKWNVLLFWMFESRFVVTFLEETVTT